jgi:hypothetical protein
MEAIITALALLLVPTIVFGICILIAHRSPKFTDGYVGIGSDMRAQRNNKTGAVTYTMDGSTWHKADYLAETFRTEPQWAKKKDG